MRWRDERALSLALTIAFGVMVAASVLLAIALANRISVVRDFKHGHFGNAVVRADDADDFVTGSSSVYGFTQLVIVVVFIVWMFRAAKNSEALGRAGARFGPGWSIGSWFIPLANFVIPVLIMQDLWRGSDLGRARDDRNWRATSGSALVATWWAVWIVSFLRYAATNAGFHGNNSLDHIERSNFVELVGVVATGIAAILALFVVRGLTRRQLETLRAQRAVYESSLAPGAQ
jgi:hypothetical protein